MTKFKDNDTTCPMKFIAGDGNGLEMTNIICDHEECEWWNKSAEMCAVTEIAYRLSLIQDMIMML